RLHRVRRSEGLQSPMAAYVPTPTRTPPDHELPDRSRSRCAHRLPGNPLVWSLTRHPAIADPLQHLESSLPAVSTFLLPSLTIRERPSPIVRTRPSSVHMDSVWFQTDLMGNSEYCAEKSCRSTIHQSLTTATQRTERQLLADAVYRPCGYDHLQKLDKSPSLPVSLA